MRKKSSNFFKDIFLLFTITSATPYSFNGYADLSLVILIMALGGDDTSVLHNTINPKEVNNAFIFYDHMKFQLFFSMVVASYKQIGFSVFVIFDFGGCNFQISIAKC